MYKEKYELEQCFYLVRKPLKDEKGIAGFSTHRIGVIAIGTNPFEGGVKITFAGSVCSTKDNFSARAGKKIAFTRLNSERVSRSGSQARKVCFDCVTPQLFECIDVDRLVRSLDLFSACEAMHIDYVRNNEKLQNVLGFVKNKYFEEKKNVEV